jgi:hypothetical protein
MKDRLARKLKGLKYPSIHKACLLSPQNTGAETTGTKKQEENMSNNSSRVIKYNLCYFFNTSKFILA